MSAALNSLPETLPKVKHIFQPLGDTHRLYPCKEDGDRWHTHHLKLQKCSCGSVWCKVCWPKSRGNHESKARLSTFDWRRTRHLILSTDPSKFDSDGERAWREITFNRGLGNLVKNLERTEDIPIVDWIAFLEWYTDGFPHWHLFIEVEKAGKEGMIGEEKIHRYWPKKWAIIIKEKYIKSEFHWNSLTGYFDGHGYFEGGKGHQGDLPAWAKQKNIRIKRYETMKRRRGIARMIQNKTFDVGQYNGVGILPGNILPKGKSPMRSYSLILDSCGAQSKLTVTSNGSANSFTIPIKYRIAKLSCGWEYIEGRGLTKSLSEDGYNSLLERMAKLEWITDTLESESSVPEWTADRMGARPLTALSPELVTVFQRGAFRG